jgi:hypothetical protein
LVQTFSRLADVSKRSDREHTGTQGQQSFDFVEKAKFKILQPKVSTFNKNYPKSRISTIGGSKAFYDV